jgi:hypothetical protein
MPTAILGKRSPEFEYGYGDDLEERKLVKLAPSTINNGSKYNRLQEDKQEKLLDDRPERDPHIPPLPLLYRGFGLFYDAMNNWTQTPECHAALRDNVDELMDMMCELTNVQRKKDDAHEVLVRILFPGSQKTFRYGIDDSIDEKHSITRKTDGHILGAHNGPLFIAGFKTDIAAAEVQLANHFMLLSSKVEKDIFLSWRLPCLGLLIRGVLPSLLPS